MPAAAAGIQCSLLPPLQAQMSSSVPLPVRKPGSSRHRPAAGVSSWPVVPTCQRCDPLPLQVARVTAAPLPVPAAVTHFPDTRSVPSAATVQLSLATPVQVQRSSRVPSAVRPPGSSRHLPPFWTRTGPAGPWLAAPATVHENVAVPDTPRASVAGAPRECVPVVTGQPLIRPLLLIDAPAGSPVAVQVGA